MAYCRALIKQKQKCLLVPYAFQFLIRWLEFACSCFALFHLYFTKQTLALLAYFWTLTFAGLHKLKGKYIETSIARCHVTNFPFRNHGKIVVVLSNISLTPPQEGWYRQHLVVNKDFESRAQKCAKRRFFRSRNKGASKLQTIKRPMKGS